MKIKLLLLIVVTILLSSITINAQTKRKTKKERPLIDYRIDNMTYWRKLAKQGLVPVQPKVAPPKATFKRTLISSRDTNEDSVDVPVSDTGGDTQSEVSIFVNPTDNGKVLNSNNSTTWTGTTFGVLYGANSLQSDDYAATWGGSIEGVGGANRGDPAAVISLTGRQYVGFIHNSGGQGVSYSDDGIAWTSVIAGPSTGGTLDKNHLWIDNSPTSAHEGNLYDAWVDFDSGSEIYLVRSTDDGLTYSSPMNISAGVNAGNFCQGVNIQTGVNGEVYAVWSIYDSSNLETDAYGFAKSLDGGATFSTATRIITNTRGIRQGGVLKNHRVNSFPSMTVDISTGPNSGNIYMVWSNVGVPGTNTGTNKSIYMIKSTDQGATWSTPMRVNQSVYQEGKEAYFPWITSDTENGDLSMIFYDDR